MLLLPTELQGPCPVPQHRALFSLFSLCSLFSLLPSPQVNWQCSPRLLVRTEVTHWQMGLVAKWLPHQHTPKTFFGWKRRHNKAAASQRPPCLICLPSPLCGFCFQACFGTRENILCNGQEKKKRKKNQSLCPQNVNEKDLQSHNRRQRDTKEI